MYSYGEGASSSRAYQGYPYVNPAVVDAPSIDADTAARWAHLPRRPAYGKTDIGRPQPTANSSGQQLQASSSKVDLDTNPVVYIELPATNGSDVAEPRTASSENEAFVQETIFYDQFKDQRIDMDRTNSEGDSSAACSSQAQHNTRPSPPDSLSLNSPTGGPNPACPGPNNAYMSNIPPSLSKETSVYGSIRSPEEVFPSSSENFPEPPPAYSEQDNSVHSLAPTPATVLSPTTPVMEQPRTQVITSGNGQLQKFLYCSYCNTRTHTLVIKQTGTLTHLIAVLFFICGLFPLTILIYCTDICKYHNHYCKQCNERIAYEIPALCQELTYVSNQ